MMFKNINDVILEAATPYCVEVKRILDDALLGFSNSEEFKNLPIQSALQRLYGLYIDICYTLINFGWNPTVNAKFGMIDPVFFDGVYYQMYGDIVDLSLYNRDSSFSLSDEFCAEIRIDPQPRNSNKKVRMAVNTRIDYARFFDRSRKEDKYQKYIFSLIFNNIKFKAFIIINSKLEVSICHEAKDLIEEGYFKND